MRDRDHLAQAPLCRQPLRKFNCVRYERNAGSQSLHDLGAFLTQFVYLIAMAHNTVRVVTIPGFKAHATDLKRLCAETAFSWLRACGPCRTIGWFIARR